MAKRTRESAAMAARYDEVVAAHEPESVSWVEPRAAAASAHDPIELAFYDRGDRGLVEPPVYLPTNSLLVPLVGVLFLAGLTALVLL